MKNKTNEIYFVKCNKFISYFFDKTFVLSILTIEYLIKKKLFRN